MSAAETAREVAPDVFRVDAQYPVPGQTCCYLIRHNGKGAVIDCGGKRGADAAMDGLAAIGVAPPDVEWVMPTHAHLDHAGGAGLLMLRLPNAVLAAHPSAVKHLIDPNRVLAPAVRALYGAEYYDEHYGELSPVAADRTRALEDGEELTLGGDRPLRAVYSPGHAWHCVSWHDKTASFLAAGDSFGVSYREMDRGGKSLIVPVMPPTQFNPEAMEKSVRLLSALDAEIIGVSHFGETTGAADLAEQQLTALRAWMRHAEDLFAEGRENFYRRMFDYLLNWSVGRAAAAGADADVARRRHKSDSHLSASGFLDFFDKRRREPPAAR